MGVAEDIGTGSEWIAAALSASGYEADFSGPSLHEIDRFVSDNTENGQPLAMGLLGRDTARRVFSLGAYVGEVIRREIGGEWRIDEADPTPDLNAALVLPGGTTATFPMQHVASRIVNGPDDALAQLGTALGVVVGEPPSRWRGDIRLD